MRRAFTLIELLTVVAIISIMAAAAVVGLNSGQGGARLRGAARDIFATIRQGRSIALVSQQPCVITYSTVKIDGETCAKIELTSARLMGASNAGPAWTLSGERIYSGADGEDEDAGDSMTDGKGETVEEILFAPMSEELTKGIAIKVALEDETPEFAMDDAKRKSKISAFSNVDYLIGKFNEAKERGREEQPDEDGGDSVDGGDDGASVSGDGMEAPKSVVWETNGRCEPHRVWVYEAGAAPEDGLCIRIDRFGAVKITNAGEDDD